MNFGRQMSKRLSENDGPPPGSGALVEAIDHEKDDDIVTGGGIELTTRTGHARLKDVIDIPEEDILREINREFPKADTLPNAYAVIQTCLSSPEGGKYEGAGYSVGDWVEIQGPDTKWRLATVRRIIKQAPDEWDWNDEDNIGKEPNWEFYYNCGEQRMLEEEYLRSPKEGLMRIFGRRPWVWQSYALLRYENFVRFQANHENDFDEVDAQEYARQLWTEWLENERNGDFKAVYDDVGEIGQQELLEHILSPFIDIDDVTETENGTWDFDDENISAFTYLAVLGTGALIPLICLTMQIAIPLLLFQNAKAGRLGLPGSHEGSGYEAIDSILTCSPGTYSNFGDDSTDQAGFNTRNGKIMSTLVVIFYLFQVVPDTMHSFFNTAGTADTSYSKIMSMRKMVWDQGDDYIGQMIGYKLDLYMNTVFECFLYSLNLFIIYNTNDILDVILNALAIEFVHQLDEGFRASSWWDGNDRAIQAGVVELIIQKTLSLNMLKDYKRFANWIGEDEEKVKAACGGEGECLYNRKLALSDNEKVEFMNGDEAWEWRCAEAAKKLGRKFAIEEYEKPFSYFGFEGKLYEVLTGRNDLAYFNKLESFRVWSRWEQVLFMAAIPGKETWDEGAKEELEKVESNLETTFANHNVIAGTSPMWAFTVEVFEVLTFLYTWRSVKTCFKNKNYVAMVFRLLDGSFNWVCYFFQLAFPFLTLFLLGYFAKCY